MEKIIFGGAVLSILIVSLTFVVSLSIFLWNWMLDAKERFKNDFNKGFQDAMESD